LSTLEPTGVERHWQLHRPLFSLLGARCRILDAHGNLVLFAKRRALRLRQRPHLQFERPITFLR